MEITPGAGGSSASHPHDRSVADLKGILQYDGPARTLEDMEAGIVEGTAESGAQFEEGHRG